MSISYHSEVLSEYVKKKKKKKSGGWEKSDVWNNPSLIVPLTCVVGLAFPKIERFSFWLVSLFFFIDCHILGHFLNFVRLIFCLFVCFRTTWCQRLIHSFPWLLFKKEQNLKTSVQLWNNAYDKAFFTVYGDIFNDIMNIYMLSCFKKIPNCLSEMTKWKHVIWNVTMSSVCCLTCL